MNLPWDWTETDINELIREQRPEDLSLDYKRSESLDKSKKDEIAKDVSAMANSAGGVLVYGLDEQKKTNGPVVFDGGVDAQKFTTEWLEQVIDSNIQRRIDGVRVNKVPMAGTNNVVYVVSVPQSDRAPHMAAHRYYKRLGTTTAHMEEYEVRDVARRMESPDLDVGLEVRTNDDPSSLVLIPWVTNTSPEPAFYATFRLYFASCISLTTGEPLRWKPISDWSPEGFVTLFWEESELRKFDTYHLFWGTPERKPLLEGERMKAANFEFTVPMVTSHARDRMRWVIGCEIRSPKMPTKIYALTLDTVEPEIFPRRMQLRRP
jgi:hypothetical protein